MFYPVVVEREENSWSLQLVKNKFLRSLRKKRDILRLKKKGQGFFYDWIRVVYLKEEERALFAAWSIPKKYIPRAVDRNRLRRWGRENLKKSLIRKGQLLTMFLPKEKGFYKNLKRKDFDNVFKNIMEKIYKKFK